MGKLRVGRQDAEERLRPPVESWPRRWNSGVGVRMVKFRSKLLEGEISTRGAGLFEASAQYAGAAIAMGKLGVGRQDAEERLRAAGGVVAKALE
jgi:hypothetical protein